MGSPFFFKPDAGSLYASQTIDGFEGGETIDSRRFPKPVLAGAVGVMVSMMGSHFQRKID